LYEQKHTFLKISSFMFHRESSVERHEDFWMKKPLKSLIPSQYAKLEV